MKPLHTFRLVVAFLPSVGLTADKFCLLTAVTIFPNVCQERRPDMHSWNPLNTDSFSTCLHLSIICFDYASKEPNFIETTVQQLFSRLSNLLKLCLFCKPAAFSLIFCPKKAKVWVQVCVFEAIHPQRSIHLNIAPISVLLRSFSKAMSWAKGSG